MSNSASSKALARSYGGERGFTVLIGFLALVAGALVLVVGFGWLGGFRAARPVLDPLAVSWYLDHAVLMRTVLVVVGILLLIAGLWWVVRSLRPETRPDLELDRTVGRELTVTAGAIADAVQADAEALDGVAKAKARAVGDTTNPALRLTLWLREGVELRSVWAQLDQQVLARARESLGVDTLPTAVRIELESGERQRVR